MNEKQIFNKFIKVRTETLELAKSIPVEIIDLVPEGFSNNIRWNLGHILVAWDHGIYPNLKQERRETLHYHSIFPKGTYPSLEAETPAFEEILNKLEVQLESIIENSMSKLEEPLIVPFIPRIKTLRNMFQFHIKHEEHHLKCIQNIMNSIMQDKINLS